MSQLATMYALEAISSLAFRRLARELADLGAPPDLVQDARLFAEDEARHAALARSLVLTRNVNPKAPRIIETAERWQRDARRAIARKRRSQRGSGTPVARRRRSLADLATENAVEGCVRETWGALVALYQAEHAKDADVRSFFAAIAGDEARHAQWSWRLSQWAATRMSPRDRRRVGAARSLAFESLSRALSVPIDDVGRTLGVPTSEIAIRLCGALFSRLGFTPRHGDRAPV